jgi:energy-coupling factor transporter ATP-binding protein EcfA2
MEILYLYVSEHPVLPDADINFGGRSLFNFSVETLTLTSRANPFHLEGFFNMTSVNGLNGRITNVTGIVGENGAGKSSLLNYMKELLPRGYYGIKANLILACRDGEGITIYFTAGYISNLQDLEKQGFILVPLRIQETPTPFPITEAGQFANVVDYPEIEAFQNTDLVYFSNVFDNGNIPGEIDGLADISTNYLTTYDFTKNRENLTLSDQSNLLEEHRYEEIRRQLEFINNFDFKPLLPFDLPEFLVVTFKKGMVWDFLSKAEKDRLEDSGYTNLYQHYLKRYHTEIDQILVNSERFKVRIILVAFLNLIVELSLHYSKLNPSVYVAQGTDPDKEGYIVSDIKNLLSERKRNNVAARKDPAHEIFQKKLDGVLSFIDVIEAMEIKDEDVGDSEAGSLVWFINDDLKQVDFLVFYRMYKESFALSPFLNFTWRNLSSGEKALFSIFSRFYSLVNTQVADNKMLKKSLFVLLDEPDTYLHPDWQKRLVEILCSFLPVIYSRDEHDMQREIQICFTSNHPLTISDLPHTNLIFLKKNRSGKTYVQDSLDDKKMTFAANIFSLFADTFFLKNGFTGSFARQKINQIIDDLNSPDVLSTERKKEIKIIIQMIGETLLRNKLADMFQTKEQLTNSYESRISRLENQVFKNDQNKKG